MVGPTIASGALRKLLTAASTYGVDVDGVLARVGVTREALDDHDARVPISALHAAWDAVLASGQRTGSIVGAARAFTPADYGLVGFVVVTSETFVEAIDQFVRYIRLWTDEPQFRRVDSAIVFAYKSAFP